MLRLRTERLTLRSWRADDEDDVAFAYEIYRRPEVTRWLGVAEQPWPDLEATRQRLLRWAKVAEDHPGYGLWAVVPDEVGHPVGTALLLPLANADDELTEDVEVGWEFNPDYWGHGYATEAAAAVLGHAFSTVGLEIVNAVAFSGNEPSLAVMRRLGMTHRGETSQWYGVTLDWWTVDRPAIEQR